MTRLYDVGNRDIVELDTYEDHVHAMTGEKLHRKSDIAAELAFRDERIAELKKELNVPINLNQFNYAFYKTNSGSVDDFYEWLKKWKHISAKVDENE